MATEAASDGFGQAPSRIRPKEHHMSDMDDFNSKIIEEFRSNGGKVAGQFEGAPMLLLHTVGAKSGAARVNPMMFMEDGERKYVFASKAGAPTNPDWYYNLLAHPDVSIEVGTDTVDVVATPLERSERDRIFAEQVSRYPGFGDYEKATDRIIPVVALDPR
jgi:deazaflavin-dependent oxidoreductase (nitroreductase family)